MPTKVCSDCGGPFTQLTKRKCTRCRNCQTIFEATNRRDKAINKREQLLASLGSQREFAEDLVAKGVPVEQAHKAARVLEIMAGKG